MQNKKTTLATISLAMLLFTSCSGERGSKINADHEIENPKKKTEKTENFKPGTWKIDSVGENELIKDRLIENSTIQVFNFRKDGVFSTMEVTSGMTKDREIGTWKAAKDSVFILGESGKIAMSYGFKIDGEVLTLKGNFQISSNNGKKPSFYLSKYVEKSKGNIFGPEK